MKQAGSQTINRLPAITWYWLRANEGIWEDAEARRRVIAEIQCPEGIRQEQAEQDPLEKQTTGAGEAAASWVEAGREAVHVFSTESDAGSAEPVCIRLQYPEQAGQADAFSLQVAADSRMTVIQDLSSGEKAEGVCGVRTRFSVADGGVLQLFQIVRPGSDIRLLQDLGGTCIGTGRVELRQLFLTTGQVFQGGRVDLTGDGSTMDTEISYLVSGNGKLDMNYLASHTGRKTGSDIRVHGVLRGQAEKLFRGTIDFIKGAAGAVGNEIEDVLLMDDNVKNQTIPLILCAEEDVVGNHGATIGRLDEQLLFYASSRGMTREQIYEMMARARMDALIRQIPDADLQQALGFRSDKGE